MFPASIAKRTYLITTLLISVLVLFFAYEAMSTIREQAITENEKNLLTTASLLDQQVPPDTGNLLRDESTRRLTHKEKLALFNSQLQPVLAKVGKIYTHYGMGYGVDGGRLAVYPPRPEIMEKPFSEAAQQALQRARDTKQVQYFTNSHNILWGQPTVSILYPHIIDNEVIWFTWVNTKIENLDKAYAAALWRSAGTFFCIWVGVMLVLCYIFRRLDTSLKNLAVRVMERKDARNQLDEFPELETLFNAVITLRQGLEEECVAKTLLNEQIRDQAKLLDMAHDAIIVRNLQDKIIYWNGGAELCYGWTKEEAMNCTMQDILNTVFLEPIEKIFATLHTAGHWQGELVHTGKNGAKIIAKSYWTLNRDEQGNAISVMEINHDVTKQRQSEELFHKAFSNNPIMMGIVSMQTWVIVDVNAAYLELVGLTREEVVGRTPEQIGIWKSNEDIALLRQEVKDHGRVRNYEINICTKHGERTLLFSCDQIKLGEERCSLDMFNDITEIRCYEKELAHFDRLNVIGEMAAGIGHEVRNPMTTVRGYLQLFQKKEEFTKYLDQINTMIEELDRANSIISEFLSLSKDKTVEMKSGNLNDSVQFLYPLLQADAFCRGHNLYLELGVVPDIEFDDKEIRQLVLNIVRNGLESMEQSGAVTIRTWSLNGQVFMEIEDMGIGIPPEILAKLGIPFLTTKEQGTGLGLAVCYRIAERHGAKICIETGELGTTFAICFPPKV